MKINEFTIQIMKQADIYKVKPYVIDKRFHIAYKKPPLLNKSKYEKEVENLIYCYAYFLEANLGVGRVLVLEDMVLGTDTDKISEVASQLMQAVSDSSNYSSETQQFICRYKEDKLGFDAIVPSEICGDVKAHICPIIFAYDDLPNKQIPAHRFMPCFLLPNVVKGKAFLIVNLIKGKFYEL